MKEMNERISAIIEASGIKKTVFANRLNVSQAFVSQLCSGVKQPSDRTIADICREFDVNETWLRTGEGEMFIQRTRNQQITDFLGDLIKEEDGTFKKRLIEAMSKLDKKDWEDLERLVNKLTKKGLGRSLVQ